MRLLLKLFTLFLPVAFSASTAFSQTPGHLKLLESGSLETIHKVSDGGYITLGTTTKLHVIKWAENFDKQWSVTLEDNKFYNLAVDVIESSAGNFYVAAASTEYGGSVMIIKLNSAGSVLWQKNYSVGGNFLTTFFLSQSVGQDDGFVFGGGQCAYSNFIIQCDANGNVAWQKQYIHSAGSGVQTAFDVLVDGNEYILSSSFGINSLFTLRLSATGALIAHTAYTSTNGNQIIPEKIIRLTSNNRFAVFGNSNNNMSSFVAILDNNLALLNYYEVITPYTEYSIKDIAAVNNGAEMVLSANITTGTFGVDLAGFSSTLKMTQAGTIVWTKRREGVNTLGSKNVYSGGLTAVNNTTFQAGAGIYEGSTVTIMDENGNGACNNLTSTISLSNLSLSTTAGTVSVINASVTVTPVNYTLNTTVTTIKEVVCGAGDLSASSEETAYLQVFPVPASDYVVLKDISGDHTPKNVRVYAADGKLIQLFELNEMEYINTNAFENGVYIVTIEHQNTSSTHRFVVQH
jgi:hypothetical protein